MRTQTTASRAIAETRAREILRHLQIREPDEIDLELIAAQHNVFIEVDSLTSHEARIVRRGDTAIITVNSFVTDDARKRFSIGHELGHFFLHADTRQLAMCTENDMQNWDVRVKSEETEANAFSAELLMPKDMAVPRLTGKAPSLALVSEFKELFNTSFTASAIQVIKYTSEPCALIATKNRNRIWWVGSESFRRSFWLRKGLTLHPYTQLHELQEGGAPTGRANDVPAGAWLDRYDPQGKACLTEDSVVLQAYDIALSLLWIHEDI